MKSILVNSTSSNLLLPDDLFCLLLEFRDYAIMMLDSEGRILNWNLGAEYIYGYTMPEIMQQPVFILFPVGELNEQHIQENFQKALQNGRMEYNCWQQKKDGALFYANIIKTPLWAADGALRGYAQLVKDITAQKALNDEAAIFKRKLEEQVMQRTGELEVAIKELEAFSYSVSHDLRAPLRSIIGFSRILLEDYAVVLDEEGKRLLNKIINSAALMSQLIDDLLKFSRMSKLEIVNAKVDMGSIVNAIIRERMQTGEYTDCQFVVKPMPQCMADESMLRQVWFNLLDNAIKYSSKTAAPVIEIGGNRKEGVSEYYIKDNGVGFDMKYADKLFGVFQRLHSQIEFPGTGLGLALVQRILRKHNGEIRADAAPDGGATFYFTIPDKLIYEYTS